MLTANPVKTSPSDNRRGAPLRAGAALALGCVALAGCSPTDGGGASADASVAPEDRVAISMAVWSGFGLEDLVATYESEHPGVSIDLQTGTYNDLHTELQQELTAGVGAPTIAAIGEDYIAKFAAQPAEFIDLGPVGADALEANYLPWKWAEGQGSGGEVIGLGGDVSGLALCYRSDLLEKAGLPFSREDVNAAVGDSWDGLITLGEKYSKATSGKAFLDSAASVVAPMRQQGGYSYYAADGTLDIADARPAFDVAVSLVDKGLSAGVTPYSDAWTTGLDSGAFAATLCPVWGMGYIEGQLTESGSQARWDVADVPGPGGSWGGTFYAITAQASPSQQAAAWEFLEWLMEPTQQLAMLQSTGSLPSQPALYEDGAVTGYTNTFFQDAPVGPMLAAAVTEMPTPDRIALKDATIEETLEAVIDGVQSGTAASSEAWAIAEEAAKQADGA